jgi:anhydro-N-acetylmuramic acid kinase
MRAKAMIVAGVMSGTSADGINVALVKIEEKRGGARCEAVTVSGVSQPAARSPRITLIGHAEYSYPPKVRQAVIAAMNATQASVADLSRLNFVLGELYADAVLAAQKKFHAKACLIGCHGQTLYHQGDARLFLGHKVMATWQTGEGAVTASRVGVPVVSDFRPADMAVGGKGAPLVPFLDYMWFRDRRVGRIAQNIGGIANLTAIPAGASAKQIRAFDTGPGNMVIDACMEALYGKSYDRGGKVAASGKIIEPVVNRILRRSFFRAKPPKTAGREEFGREFVREFLHSCGRAPKPDVIATATTLTARSIAHAVQSYVVKSGRMPGNFRELIVSGGGAKNATLMRMLSESLTAVGLRLRFSDEFGLPSEAKEAVAFALLAYETWNQRPSNIPSATGAKHPAVLGKISYA